MPPGMSPRRGVMVDAVSPTRTGVGPDWSPLGFPLQPGCLPGWQ